MEESKRKSNRLKWMESQMYGEPWQQSRFYGYSIKNLKYLHQPVTVRWTEPTWNREERGWNRHASQSIPKTRSDADQGRRMVRHTVDTVTGEIVEEEYIDSSGAATGDAEKD